MIEWEESKFIILDAKRKQPSGSKRWEQARDYGSHQASKNRGMGSKEMFSPVCDFFPTILFVCLFVELNIGFPMSEQLQLSNSRLKYAIYKTKYKITVTPYNQLEETNYLDLKHGYKGTGGRHQPTPQQKKDGTKKVLSPWRKATREGLVVRRRVCPPPLGNSTAQLNWELELWTHLKKMGGFDGIGVGGDHIKAHLICERLEEPMGKNPGVCTPFTPPMGWPSKGHFPPCSV